MVIICQKYFDHVWNNKFIDSKELLLNIVDETLKDQNWHSS